MPASSAVITAAGTTFAISATLPATHDIPGFEALSYTNVAEIFDGGSGGGKTYNKVTYSPLATREVEERKGSFSYAQKTLQLGRNLNDAGQRIMLDALDSDNAYAFKITYQNGDVNYITATVDGFDETIGTTDTIVSATSAIKQCQDTIRLFVSGVLTATVNAGGTFTGETDGTFPATQALTSGVGNGAEFLVTLVAGAVTAAIPTNTGVDYVIADTITLLVSGGPVESVAAVLDVATIVTL